MGVADSYDYYINRLKRRRGENVHYQQAQQNIARLSIPYREMSNKMGQAMRRDDAPYSAKMEQGRQLTNDYNQLAFNVHNEASMRDAERRDQLDAQIDEVGFQRQQAVEAERERKKAEERAKKAGWWQLGAQAIGTAGDLILAPFTGGASLALGIGSKLGSAIGGAAAYNLTGNPGDLQGVVDGIGGMVNNVSQHYANKKVQAAAPKIKAIIGKINESNYEQIKTAIEMWAYTGDESLLELEIGNSGVVPSVSVPQLPIVPEPNVVNANRFGMQHSSLSIGADGLPVNMPAYSASGQLPMQEQQQVMQNKRIIPPILPRSRRNPLISNVWYNH